MQWLAYWHVFDLVFVVLLFFFDALWMEKVHPFERQFTINDVTIMHPFAEHERVTGASLVSWSMFLPPVVIVAIVTLFTPLKYKFYFIYVANLCYYCGLFTTVMVTDVLKNWIGRLRPDFLDRCKPLPEAVPNVLYLAKDICSTYKPGTGEYAKLMDGFRTTPSGHSSMAFSLGVFLTMFLLSQLNALRVKYSVWRFIVATLPLYGSFYVALSRTQDYRHHFVDVIIGSFLGGIITWLNYRRFWPSLWDKYPYVPKQLLHQSEEEETGEWFELDKSIYVGVNDIENQASGPNSSFQ